MKTINVNLYKFNELNPAAQKKAIEKYHDINTDYDWYRYSILDFQENLLNSYGIDTEYNNIEFSGFSNQGDGASFTSNNINTEKLIQVFNVNFRNEYLKKLFILWYDNFEIVRTSSYYSHCYTVSVKWQDDFDYYNGGSHPRLASYFTKKATEIEEKLNELKDNLCMKLYIDLEKEYYFLQSEEQIKETLIANDYDFYSDGTIY